MVGNVLDKSLKRALGVVATIKERRENLYRKGEELISKAPKEVKDLMSSISGIRRFAREKLLEKIANAMSKIGFATRTDVEKIMKRLEDIEKKTKKG